MLLVPESVRSTLLERARSGAPKEVCGVLAGEYGEYVSTVERAIAAPNAAAHPRTTYEIAPTVLLETIESIEGAGDDVVGFYHSHPDGPVAPSPTDVAEATWSGYSYLLCLLEPAPVIGSWRWDGPRDRFARECLRTMPVQ